MVAAEQTHRFLQRIREREAHGKPDSMLARGTMGTPAICYTMRDAALSLAGSLIPKVDKIHYL